MARRAGSGGLPLSVTLAFGERGSRVLGQAGQTQGDPVSKRKQGKEMGRSELLWSASVCGAAVSLESEARP